MDAAVIGLLAETSLHPGAGATGGVIDLPVAREATTGYPVLMGSGLKGALRDRFESGEDGERAKIEAEEIFGKPEAAGGIAVTDGRLLLLPVRSLTGHYRWATCSYILERFRRDLDLAGINAAFEIPQVKSNQAKAAEGGSIYLEELSFETEADPERITGVAEAVAGLVCHKSVRDRLVKQLVVLGDDDFKYFASYGLPVNARNVLNDATKTSENLWYEETIPPDTLFYALILPRRGSEGQLERLKFLFSRRPYLQVGGNETVGQGWCAVAWLARG